MKQILSNEHFLAYSILQDSGIEDDKAYLLATTIVQEIIPPKQLVSRGENISLARKSEH